MLCQRSLLVLDKQRRRLLLGAAARLSQNRRLATVQPAERASRRAGLELPVRPLALLQVRARPVRALPLARAQLVQVPSRAQAQTLEMQMATVRRTPPTTAQRSRIPIRRMRMRTAKATRAHAKIRPSCARAAWPDPILATAST